MPGDKPEVVTPLLKSGDPFNQPSALPDAKEKRDWEDSCCLIHCSLGARDRAQGGENLAVDRFSTDLDVSPRTQHCLQTPL